MSWADQARAIIAEVHAGLPADANLKEREAALKQKAYWFHGGTSWGKKIWGRECRAYYEKHGQKPRVSHCAINAPLFASDIIFPFRDK